jgi:ribosomal protein L15
MNLARQINKYLDEILEINKVRDDKLKKHCSKLEQEDIEDLSDGEITKREQEINKITNNGQNIRDIFTNDYYINDVMQDREIREKIQNEDFINGITGNMNN